MSSLCTVIIIDTNTCISVSICILQPKGTSSVALRLKFYFDLFAFRSLPALNKHGVLVCNPVTASASKWNAISLYMHDCIIIECYAISARVIIVYANDSIIYIIAFSW